MSKQEEKQKTNDAINDLKVSKEVRIFDETESIVIGTFSSIGFLILVQGIALSNKYQNFLKATLMTVGSLVFYTVAGSLVYFMYQDDETAVDLKVGWGIIGGTAGFLFLIFIVISLFNRSSVSDSDSASKKRTRRRQRRNSTASSSSSGFKIRRVFVVAEQSCGAVVEKISKAER
ncbi:unnamed protein product [Oikopleura dioica]|uniref:Uncharacterized protein n=1 Tax=Oikopleura dioica TaxID=34765 RepID=E4XIR0_OIKDI|nr:unnamed protein product [Oikopleura dioica]